LSAMGLYIGDDCIHTLCFALVSGFQHGIGFTNSRCITQEDFQPAVLPGPLFYLHVSKQLVGIGTIEWV